MLKVLQRRETILENTDLCLNGDTKVHLLNKRTKCRPWAGQCPGSLGPRANKDRAEAETSPRTTLKVGAVIGVTVVGTWSEEISLWEEGIGADAWTLKRKQPLREERSRWREQLQRPEAGTNGPVRGKEKHVRLARSQGRGGGSCDGRGRQKIDHAGRCRKQRRA